MLSNSIKSNSMTAIAEFIKMSFKRYYEFPVAAAQKSFAAKPTWQHCAVPSQRHYVPSKHGVS